MSFLGVDIGGTKIAAAVVDVNGIVHSKSRIETPASAGGDTILQAAIGLSQSLLSSTSDDITAIGIGTGGQVDAESGTIYSATELLPGWAGQPIKERFRKSFNLPIYIENDVNALALGEQRFGGLERAGTTVFLALGTGVGGAVLIDGKLHHGAHWSGGEAGHMIVNIAEDAWIDSGGHQGTLEAYASGHALVRIWREITGDRSEISGQEIGDEAMVDSGSPAVLAVTQLGRNLGLGLVSIVSLLDPDRIIIGGGLAALGDLLLDPARVTLRERALPGSSECPVSVSSLGASSSLIGAATVAIEGVSCQQGH